VRTRYQHGTIELKERARGPAIWQFRWRDRTGKRMSEDIGTTIEYKTRSAVDRCSKVAYLRMKVNTDQPAEPDEKFGVVLERYVQEEIPKRFSTQHAYLSYINNHIRPKWGEFPLTQVKPLAVRDWLKAILDKKNKRPLANKTRGHIKGLMHRIFDCAMLWEYLPPDRNPMSLVRIEGSSKRRKKPRVLTPEEFSVLVARVNREPCRTMVILALCTGVRCSELVALKWSDFDWENLSVYIRRAIVAGRVDDVKTEYSEAPLPLDPALAEVILEWRRRTEFSAESDFVFASPYMAGEKPYTPWNMQHNHLSPAAIKAGLGPIGWHTLRHTYRAWLGDNGEALTVQKELMRHASIQTTLNTYGGGMMDSMREAHGRVVKQAIAR
jgi:integrase